MQFAEYFAIAFLGLTIGALTHHAGRAFVVSNVKKFFTAAVLGVLGIQVYSSFLQYYTWFAVAPTKYLLPPYANWNYFINYAGWRFFAPYILSFFVGLLFFWLARKYNSWHENQFFYEEEYYFIAWAVFLVGHPGWILYSAAIILTGVLIIGWRTLILKKSDKFSFYYLWSAIAIFVIIISKWVAALDFYKLLKL